MIPKPQPTHFDALNLHHYNYHLTIISSVKSNPTMRRDRESHDDTSQQWNSPHQWTLRLI